MAGLVYKRYTAIKYAIGRSYLVTRERPRVDGVRESKKCPVAVMFPSDNYI